MSITGGAEVLGRQTLAILEEQELRREKRALTDVIDRKIAGNETVGDDELDNYEALSRLLNSVGPAYNFRNN